MPNMYLTSDEARKILSARHSTLHQERAAIEHACLILYQSNPDVYLLVKPHLDKAHDHINEALNNVVDELTHLRA